MSLSEDRWGYCCKSLHPLKNHQTETEKLLAELVEAEINKRLKEGTYKGKKFNVICHFFGYQARTLFF
nr:pyrophosphate--fructose 6-phosphate 1-phosphotransferase subunit alpha [Tanacetum cinerariifolium]